MNNDLGAMTPRQLIAHFESGVNELKANNVQMVRDVDGRVGYAVVVDHVIFCALLRDDRLFVDLSPSIIELRDQHGAQVARTAFYYAPISIFVVVP